MVTWWNHIIKKCCEHQLKRDLFRVLLVKVSFCKIEARTRGQSHCGPTIHIKKYLKAKEELWKLKYITMKKYNLQKTLQKKPKSFKVL